MNENNDKYSDMLNMPHHVSLNHKQMSIFNRAAQFAPFAALTGYGKAINEAGRITNEKKELSEQQIEILNRKIKHLMMTDYKNSQVEIIHFKKDNKKSGGNYITTISFINKIDEIKKCFVMLNGSIIEFSYIVDIKSELLSEDFD